MQMREAVCVVTGAARGIGLAIAQGLLASGARVALSDVNVTALAATVAGLRSDDAVGFPANVTSMRDMVALVEQTESVFGPLTVWINNAGFARHRQIVDYSEQEIDAMIAVNLKGTIAGSQAALRAMSERSRGHIINIISTAGLRGIPNETVYCAAKWGARGFTQGLREEAAPLGIRVTALLPGGVDTSFWADAAPERAMPVQNFLRAKQVADAVVTLVAMEDSVVPQELVLRALQDRDFAG
jgi:NAD(P)-dependent dehydrogenase (short-subunit alcohol dehydrogenase family)